MDGDAVAAEPSQEAKEPKSLAEVFHEIFPSYLAMGMSYEEFWHGSPWLVRAYRKAHEMRIRNEEWARHRQGMYFMQALKVAMSGFSKDSGKKESYPMEPWPLTEKEAKEQEQRREEENFKQYLAQLEAESERNKKLLAEKAAKEEAVKDGGE